MIKKVDDYLNEICEKFPQVPRSDIKRIVNFGLRMFYKYNLAGCDTVITNKEFWMYCGKLGRNSLFWFRYYKQMLGKKLRILFNLKKKYLEWDEYYYTALNEEEYNSYINEINTRKRGRPKSKFYFINKYSFKYYDACYLNYSWSKYIIKYHQPLDKGYKYFSKQLLCKNLEVVTIKENASTLSDILINNHDYEIL